MTIDNYKELYEERAAIRQFDGGLSQKEAEEKALSEIADLWTTDQNLRFNEGSTYRAVAQFKKRIIN
jgi:hypothetical protein